MAKAFKCDLCKKMHEGDKEGYIEVCRTNCDEYEETNSTLELCQHCYTALIKFLGGV